MTSWLAVHTWSESRALKAMTEAGLTIWRPTMLKIDVKGHKTTLQALSVFPSYMFAQSSEMAWRAICDADGVVGVLCGNRFDPRLISQSELEPAILYTIAHAMTHIRLKPGKRRRKREKGFGSLAALLDAPIAKAA